MLAKKKKFFFSFSERLKNLIQTLVGKIKKFHQTKF